VHRLDNLQASQLGRLAVSPVAFPPQVRLVSLLRLQQHSLLCSLQACQVHSLLASQLRCLPRHQRSPHLRPPGNLRASRVTRRPSFPQRS
jgi:hypothetical protein